MAETRAHKEVEAQGQGRSRRDFVRAMLLDLRALERMLEEKRFERGIKRVGAELEMFLTDGAFQPSPSSLKMLDALKDPHFTTELGLFQLEMNADPQTFSGDGFSRMEKQFTDLVDRTRKTAEELGIHALLMGILPTIRKSDLGLENMVPSPRYLALAKAVHELRGGDFEISIKGIDELVISHNSVMVEACNSSFQVHLQVDPEQFAQMYNLAQVLAGPLLSVSANSPLLFGKRLWAETRIALFQQSVDTRSRTQHQRDASPRVTFGTRFVKESIVEIFKEDIARHRTLVGSNFDEDPMKVLDKGEAPQLKALRLHNGTIYRWNRACYGIIDGKPHLRIENRVMPAGPSIPDQIANSAFWCGLMVELGDRYPDITRHIDFDHAQGNFFTAAREGIGAHLWWLDGEEFPAQRLVLDKLLPIAEAGLKKQKVNEDEIKRYLGIIEERVKSGRTGARWMLSSLQNMKERGTAAERQNALVSATLNRQVIGKPVAQWDLARLEEAGQTRHAYQRVDQVMTTDLVTVHPDDAVDLVANIMTWDKIRYVMVEDREHKLLGIVSARAVLRFLAKNKSEDAEVSQVMKDGVITVTPQTKSLEAIQLMRKHRVGCLPVLDQGRLVGVVTEENFLRVAGDLLTEKLRGWEPTLDGERRRTPR